MRAVITDFGLAKLKFADGSDLISGRGGTFDYPTILEMISSGKLPLSAQEQMLLLGRKTARERLASYLLMQSRQGLPCGRSRKRFNLPIKHRDIADYIGLTMETVSRTFTRLQAERLIDIVSPNQMEISDPVALVDLAGGMR